MTDELRALLRAELHAERPPPIGDVVGAAVRAGRRHRRQRRLGRVGLGAAVAGAVALVVVLVSDVGVAARPGVALPAGAPAAATPGVGPGTSAGPLSPETVPIGPTAPTAAPHARTLTIHKGTQPSEGTRKKATAAAMLHLLTQLLPPGRTSRYGVVPGDGLRVQLSLDGGAGPGLVRVAVDRGTPVARAASGAVVLTVRHFPDDCARSTVVDADRPDGTLVRLDVSSCRPDDGRPVPPALTTDEAVAVAVDPRWGVTMAATLVDDGAKRFPDVPAAAR